MSRASYVMVVLLTAALVAGAVGQAVAQGQPAAPGAAPGAPASAGAAQAAPAQAAEAAPAAPPQSFFDRHAETIHLIGKIGALGIFINLCIGLYIWLRHPKRLLRRNIRYVHMSIGLTFGITAMSHGTMFDLMHLVDRELAQVVNSGSWLCLSVFLLVVSGAMSYIKRNDRKHLKFWIWAHHTGQIAWPVAVLIHVIPKLLMG